MNEVTVKYEIFPEEIMEINERFSLEEATAWLLENEKKIKDYIHYDAMETLEMMLTCDDY